MNLLLNQLLYNHSRLFIQYIIFKTSFCFDFMAKNVYKLQFKIILFWLYSQAIM